MIKLIFIILSIGFAFSVTTYNEVNNITQKDPSFPFYGEMYTGFITVDNSTGAKLYYHLYAVNGTTLSDNAPLGIWLQGGPGCASAMGNFDEIGPVLVGGTLDNITFEYNNYTWNQWMHLMFIDQPTGTGFSPAFGLNVSNTWQAAAQFNVFLARFYQLFPMLQDNDLHLFGESYAGKYLPVFLYHLSNNQTFSQSTPLKGFILGDPWSDGISQAMVYSTFGYAAGMTSRKEFKKMTKLETETWIVGNQSDFWLAANYTNWIVNELNTDAGGTFPYDYREFSFDWGDYSGWLNTSEAQDFLDIPPTNYISCSNEVAYNFATDMAESVTWVYPYLIERYNIMIYNGQDDNTCCYEGVSNFINEFNWTDIKNFRMAPRVPWYYPNGTVAGLVKSYGNLTFAIVYKAGHMVPVYQKEATTIIIYKYLNKLPLSS